MEPELHNMIAGFLEQESQEKTQAEVISLLGCSLRNPTVSLLLSGYIAQGHRTSQFKESRPKLSMEKYQVSL
jgi:hypothetical protein